ncbi:MULTISPECIES: hypothetical protein [unclassified Roseovarius]|uniref:hypothetical protein n=1 Tax=unclassified Roseovarius TaxID=2614913 RepID=UPI00273F83C9|nr:hypothetical protein [Roseovarius sp. MMSF_3350]
MTKFTATRRSEITPGTEKPKFFIDLITRMFGLPRIDPLDETTGLPPLPQNSNLC